MNNKIFSEKTEEKLFQMLREFTAYVSFHSQNGKFNSFKDNLFIDTQENYKKRIWEKSKEIKERMATFNNFGEGNLLDATIQLLEIENNNLVEWHGKHGPQSKEHIGLLNLKNKSKIEIKIFEENTWNFYFSDTISDEEYFNYFTKTIGKKYALAAYLFYEKDRSNYLPIAPETFDSFFKDTAIDLITSRHCSWENYIEYIEVFKYIKLFLRQNLDEDACLIDAHSFAWIMERQYKYDLENHFYKISPKIELKEKNKEIISKARIGQNFYREELLKKWQGKSSLNDYSNSIFLNASHIKPWKDCTNEECIDVENGLLLKPDYDKLFDKGFISFSDGGKVLISPLLSNEDIKELNIHSELKIKKVSDKMKRYLLFHRNNIFKKNT